jgi:hypothetical protein
MILVVIESFLREKPQATRDTVALRNIRSVLFILIVEFENQLA